MGVLLRVEARAWYLAVDHLFGHFSLQGSLSWLGARGIAATGGDTDITRGIERAAGSFTSAVAGWGGLEHRLDLGGGACIMQLCPGFVHEACSDALSAKAIETQQGYRARFAATRSWCCSIP